MLAENAAFILFRLKLFKIWRLLPRSVRRLLVRKLVIAPRPSERLDAPRTPVFVCGVLRSSTSFGWSARTISRIAKSANLCVYGIDLSEAFAAADLDHEPESAPTEFSQPGTLLLHFNPDQFSYVLRQIPAGALKRKYVIACCTWELERLPESWIDALSLPDEIWVPSQFVYDAFVRSGYGGRLRIVPHLLRPPTTSEPNRKRFGLPNNAFLAVAAFTLRSGVARKAPLVTVEAFRRAFPENADARLILKVGDTDLETASWKRIQRAVGEDPRIAYYTQTLSEEDMWRFLDCSDVVLSLHRAEGFGLIPAQGMLLGKPVIATGWSGNLDFMDKTNSALVPYRLVPVDDPDGMYVEPGLKWADPDLDAAASALRRCYFDDGYRRNLGLKAKRSMARFCDSQEALLRASFSAWQYSTPDEGSRRHSSGR